MAGYVYFIHIHIHIPDQQAAQVRLHPQEDSPRRAPRRRTHAAASLSPHALNRIGFAAHLASWREGRPGWKPGPSAAPNLLGSRQLPRGGGTSAGGKMSTVRQSPRSLAGSMDERGAGVTRLKRLQPLGNEGFCGGVGQELDWYVVNNGGGTREKAAC